MKSWADEYEKFGSERSAIDLSSLTAKIWQKASDEWFFHRYGSSVSKIDLNERFDFSKGFFEVGCYDCFLLEWEITPPRFEITTSLQLPSQRRRTKTKLRGSVSFKLSQVPEQGEDLYLWFLNYCKQVDSWGKNPKRHLERYRESIVDSHNLWIRTVLDAAVPPRGEIHEIVGYDA
jgi:hypothetical protein